MDRLTKFFQFQIPEELLYTGVIKIPHLTLSIFLHYLVKLENYNCCNCYIYSFLGNMSVKDTTYVDC